MMIRDILKPSHTQEVRKRMLKLKNLGRECFAANSWATIVLCLSSLLTNKHVVRFLNIDLVYRVVSVQDNIKWR